MRAPRLAGRGLKPTHVIIRLSGRVGPSIGPWNVNVTPMPSEVCRRLLRQNVVLRESIAREFAALPSAHPRFDASMRTYERELLSAIDTNDATLCQVFGEPARGSMVARATDWLGLAQRPDVYDGLGSLWRHLAKDWTAEGAAGGAELRSLIVSGAAAEASRWPLDERVRILVPGCGQGRLAWALADALPHALVTGLERSEATLGFARHVLHRADTVGALRFHPFLDAFPNNWDTHSRTARLSAPDTLPTRTPNLALQLADFMEPLGDPQGTAERAVDGVDGVDADGTARLRGGGQSVALPTSTPWRPPWPRQAQHVVVTHFFLDCVDDLVAGVSAVRDALVDGGSWLFSGPLHYYQGGSYEPRPSPALSHLLELAADLGLELEGEPLLVPAPYLRRPNALLHEAAWTAAFFKARKRGGPRT